MNNYCLTIWKVYMHTEFCIQREHELAYFMQTRLFNEKISNDSVMIFIKAAFDLHGKPSALHYNRRAFNDSQHLQLISFLSHHGVKAVEIEEVDNA
jgi:hypothetical protein